MSCPVHKLGELPGRGSDLGFGSGRGIGEWMVSTCMVFYLSNTIFFFTLFSIIKLFLSQPTIFTSDSPPHSTVVGGRGEH